MIRKILVPVDFSACSTAAFERAIEVAETFGALIDVIYLWQPPTGAGTEMLLWLPGGAMPLNQYARKHANEQMEAFLSSTKRPPTVRVHARVEDGEPASTIVKIVAIEGGYDLIVMGTHGRTGLSHLLLGSIAEKVLRSSPVPVMTVRAPQALN